MHACVLCGFSPVQLLVTPWTVAHQAPLSKAFSREEHWSGLPCPPPGDIPPDIEPESPPAAEFFTTEPPGKPGIKIQTNRQKKKKKKKGKNLPYSTYIEYKRLNI